MAKKNDEGTKYEVTEVTTVIPKKEIGLLSVDYPNEGLNNMARKINEIVSIINQS